jgi:hypothetical protein
MKKDIDIGKAFDTWIDATFVSYRGVLLEKVCGKWLCMGILCMNMEDVDRVLNSGRSALGNSIKPHKQ